MKKLPLLILAFVLCNYCNAQNRVTIPDTTFVNWLQQNFPGCISGNQLDTTCAAILAYTSNGVNGLGISVYNNTMGIQYFKNLDTLTLQPSDTIFTGPYPPNLKYLRINSATNLSYISDSLPGTLLTLLILSIKLKSLPILPLSLRYLECEENKLSGALPPLPPNLNFLNCSYNNFTSLPILPDSLATLGCNNNSISTLPLLPSTLKTLTCGQTLIKTLPALPQGLRALDCNHDSIQTFAPWPLMLQFLDCSYTLAYSLPTFPVSLNVLYCDHIQAFTLPVFPDSITLLSCGSDSLLSLPDSLPPKLTDFTCYGNKITKIPPLPNGLTILSCQGTSETILPPIPPGVYDIHCEYNTKLVSLPAIPSNFQTLYLDNDSMLTCLPPINSAWYSFIYFPGTAITCLPNYFTYSSCTPSPNTLPLCDLFNTTGCPVYWNISGSVFFDQNSDCVHQTSEPFIYPVKINLYQAGSLIQQVISDGVYSFKTDTGTYTVSIDKGELSFKVACSNGDSIVTVSTQDSMINNVNFETQCGNGFDVGTDGIVSSRGFFPGDTIDLFISSGDRMKNYYSVSCNTNGLSGQVQVVLSGPAKYVTTIGGTPAPTTVNGNTLTWDIADFSQLNYLFNIKVVTDTGAIFGEYVCVDAIVTPTAGDINGSNNNVTQCFIVYNSHDPNYKEVSPPGTLAYPYNDWLTYTIHFQNTGSAAAENIHIIDTLDANIDPSTFQLLAYSKAPMVQLSGQYVTFNFPQINLKTSATDSAASMGYVQYKVKPLANLPVGTNIGNTAYIYFDYNAPVATNNAASAIDTVTATGINNLVQANRISVFPNPATNLLNISLSKPCLNCQLNVTDVTGREMLQATMNGNNATIDISAFPSGIYFIRVSTTDKTSAVKVVKL